MAGSVNKVILIGNLGRIRKSGAPRTAGRSPICGRHSDSWRDKTTGERGEKTEWHRVVIFNEGLCKIVEQYLKKGSKVYLEGHLQTRKWHDKDGQRALFDRGGAAGLQLGADHARQPRRRRCGRGLRQQRRFRLARRDRAAQAGNGRRRRQARRHG